MHTDEITDIDEITDDEQKQLVELLNKFNEDELIRILDFVIERKAKKREAAEKAFMDLYFSKVYNTKEELAEAVEALRADHRKKSQKTEQLKH